MGFDFIIFGNKYDWIYQQTLDAIEGESEEYLEAIREKCYEQAILQVSEQIRGLDKNDLEMTRVNYVHQLDDLKDEITEHWRMIAHKTTVAAITYNYMFIILLIPPLVLLVLNKVLASQICLLTVSAVIFFANIESVRNTISFYVYGLSKVSEDLSDLYKEYGIAEATITLTDYREISKVDRDHWIYSSHHQKAP